MVGYKQSQQRWCCGTLFIATMVFKILLTNRLNQDCLENLFGVIQQSGLCRESYNPTPEQFGSAIKHASINILLKSSENSRCISCSDDFIATLKTLTMCKQLATLTMSDATFLNQSCSSIPSTTASSCTQSIPALANHELYVVKQVRFECSCVCSGVLFYVV